MNSQRIAADRLESFCFEVLRRAGLDEADARTSAQALVLTDTWGVFTHGTRNLAGYLRRIRAGGIRSQGRPRLITEGPAWAMVDGDAALGMVASTAAMRVAIDKARASGIGYAGLRNSCHFGAAGCYAVLAADQGMIGLAMANDTPTMTVPGSRVAVLGSNPLAFAVPTGGPFPILLDIATSAVAGGKVFAAAAAGRSVPPSWIVDSAGQPSTDPRLFPHAGSLVPMAGHKGYGLALLIETLSAVLTGAAIASQVLSWSFADPSLPTNHGAAFLAIHIDAMMPADQFRLRVAEAIRQIREAPRVEGVEKTLLPGELEWACRQRALAEGILLPADVAASLQKLAAELSLSWPGVPG